MRVNLVFITLITLICICRPAIASDEKRELTPEFIVQKILEQSKPTSGTFVPMTNKRLEQIKHFLAPSLQTSLSEWIRTRNQLSLLGSRPDGAYDPLTYRKWQPNINVKSVKLSGDKAIVVIEESLNPSKIYSGYHGESKYLFIKHENRWLLENIKINRKYTPTNGKETVDVLNNLNKDTAEFIRLYNNNKN